MLVLLRFIRIVGVTALFSVASFSAHAEPFPAKQVTIFVPYAAGGAVDVLARTIGQSLSKIWGQQPIIENRPGAGGVIASQALAQSAPDGYKLILVASGPAEPPPAMGHRRTSPVNCSTTWPASRSWPFHTRAERLHSRRCWPEIYP
jgi:tripartite-type tricarboxylate transporter receptor subunit TctC